MVSTSGFATLIVQAYAYDESPLVFISSESLNTNSSAHVQKSPIEPFFWISRYCRLVNAKKWNIQKPLMYLKLLQWQQVHPVLNLPILWIKPPSEQFEWVTKKLIWGNKDKKINICRISIFKKPADNLFLRGFWDEKSRDANGFSIWPHLTLTGPLVKIGGLRHIFE